MIPQKNLTNEGYFEGKCEFRSLSFRVKSNNHLTSDWWPYPLLTQTNGYFLKKAIWRSKPRKLSPPLIID